jgi:hypothetical protein
MDTLMSETCSAHKKLNKIANDIKLVFYSSTILRHVPTIPDQAPNTKYNLMYIGPCIIVMVEE